MIVPTLNLWMSCFLASLPGPPGYKLDDSYFHKFPIDRVSCPDIDQFRDITFDLYTKKNPDKAIKLRIGADDILEKSTLDFKSPTIFFFHGFLESSMTNDSLGIKNAYLKRKEFTNIILVNTKRLVAGPWYITSSRNLLPIGQYTALLIDYLVSKGLDLSKVHLIGHSLGAHMAATTGSNVKSGRIPRITGLDPAGPLIQDYFSLKEKLDKSDAEFVDVIHTDSTVFGYPESIGHADFYPNAGIRTQPGCSYEEIRVRNPYSISEQIFCSHWLSHRLYAKSVIEENRYIARQCKDWNSFATGECLEGSEVPMGFATPSDAQGDYYLYTSE